MEFKVLAVGDVVGNPGMDRISRSLRYLKRTTQADFVIVNGENAAVVAHIFTVIAKVTKELGVDSYRVVSNVGGQAGQSVFHLHFHVLGGKTMNWEV